MEGATPRRQRQPQPQPHQAGVGPVGLLSTTHVARTRAQGAWGLALNAHACGLSVGWSLLVTFPMAFSMAFLLWYFLWHRLLHCLRLVRACQRREGSRVRVRVLNYACFCNTKWFFRHLVNEPAWQHHRPVSVRTNHHPEMLASLRLQPAALQPCNQPTNQPLHRHRQACTQPA